MSNRKSFWLATVFTAVMSYSFSALAETPLKLSWDEAVRLTAMQNPEIAASKERVQAAEARKLGSFSGFLPSIDAFLGYEKTEKKGTDGVSLTSGTGWTAGVNADLNLFAGFADAANVAKAEADLNEARLTDAIERARISAELKTAFETSAFARESAKLSTQILKRREENLRLVFLRFESGRENKGSVLLSEAYLEEAKLDDLQARNALRTSARRLLKAIGQDDTDTAIEVVGNVPINEPSVKSPDIETLALLSPDYLKTVEQTKSLTEAGRAARASFFPKLDLTGSIRRRGTDLFPDETDTRTVGITLSVPLFDGGVDLGKYRAAVATAEASNFVQRNALRDTRQKLEAAWSEYIESIARLRTDESFKKAATIRSEIGRTRYNNGLLTFEDWDVIENDLILRQRAVLQTRQERTTAEAEWEKAQGKGVWP